MRTTIELRHVFASSIHPVASKVGGRITRSSSRSSAAGKAYQTARLVAPAAYLCSLPYSQVMTEHRPAVGARSVGASAAAAPLCDVSASWTTTSLANNGWFIAKPLLGSWTLNKFLGFALRQPLPHPRPRISLAKRSRWGPGTARHYHHPLPAPVHRVCHDASCRAAHIRGGLGPRLDRPVVWRTVAAISFRAPMHTVRDPGSRS